METTSADTNRRFWLAEARGVARRVNLAWWLETLAAPLILAALAGAAAILVFRNRFPDLPASTLAWSIGAAFAAIALASWLVAMRRFENPDRSLVRIEAAMQLRNALSTAKAGAGPWPEPRSPDAGIRWHWPRLIVPPLAAASLLAAGIFIPVSSETEPPAPKEQPQSWKQIESSLENLTKEQLADEKYLEETRKKLDELKSQEEDQWFSHSSLEATDALEKEHRSEMDRVEKDLERAGDALESLEKNAGGQAEKERQLNEFQQALEGLQNGAMKPNPELLEQLKQLDPKNLGQLDPEKLQQLKENLKKNANGMKKAGQNPGDDWSDELLGDQDGENCDDCKDGRKPGNKPGKGGVDRGPGHDPDVLGDEKDGVETGDLTGLESKDLSNALPGDLLQLQDGEHDVDKAPSKIMEGGATDATGAGGDRVWKESLDPDEQRTLKRFFE